MTTLEKLNFDNLALKSLPLDTDEENYVRIVPGACYSVVKPTPVENPETVAYSTDAMALLDLPESELKRKELALYFSGNKILPGSEPAAHCYCGHQYGVFAGQLGDGAVIYLGEVVNGKGERWEVQLKGAGKTPYSREGNGRKGLRVAVLEFLGNEAMHFLGIPTTRAGCCITSSSTATCEDDENKRVEKCSIVTRIAPTFLRFGSFDICKTMDPITNLSGPSMGQNHILKQLLEHTILTYFPEIEREQTKNARAKFRAFYKEVVRRTAYLVAQWQSAGFCHGLLNTDNMSILGLTIDYGHFGFMERFDPNYTSNPSDENGRYSFSKQAEVCNWNLLKLGEALRPFLPLDESEQELKAFNELFDKYYMDQMRKKLGLTHSFDEDRNLIHKFLDVMELTGGDFTNCFHGLNCLKLPGSPDHATSLNAVREKLIASCCSLQELQAGLRTTIDDSEWEFLMMILGKETETIAQDIEVIEREQQRRKKIKDLKTMTPQQKTDSDKQSWNAWLEMYIERLKEEITQEDDLEHKNQKKIALMNVVNPTFILRKSMAQKAISLAAKGDYSEIERIFQELQQPFAEH